MSQKIAEPIVYKIEDNHKSLIKFAKELRQSASADEGEIILDYPTVYIHNWQKTNDYEVYIGETGNIIQRTKQHYEEAKDVEADNEEKWQKALLKNKAQLYIVGHEHFNKSLTLDIENRLIHYMLGIDCVKKIHNKKQNPQNKYYPADEFENIFRMVWKKLQRKNAMLFPSESAIKDSAIYKASPLHRLTPDQCRAKELIIQKTMDALNGKEGKQLIFIQGEAGTGKTVLNSSTFYDLYNEAEKMKRDNLKCYMLVNHNEQITVYQQIAEKLGITDKYGKVVCKPTTFINCHTPQDPIDVAFVDEAHLLLTQGQQSYKGNNQLQDIIDRSKVTVIMFDENQILTTQQYWEAHVLEYYKRLAKKNGNYYELKDQLRMSADKCTIDWIDDFTKKRKLNKIPVDSTGFEIRVFERPIDLEREIKRKSKAKGSRLSRMVATYDWPYNSKRAPEDRLKKYWEVMIEEQQWYKPWNYQLKTDLSQKEKKKIKSLAWAEQPQTINEVGSTFTIQGFDLNYVGVILGPSVQYRDGKIKFDPSLSCNDKAVCNRTLSDGSKQKFGEILLQHEVRVLMTRGINGLYIYAYDDELREALMKAAGK